MMRLPPSKLNPCCNNKYLEFAPAVDRQYSAMTEMHRFFFSDCNYYLVHSCFFFFSSLFLFTLFFFFITFLFLSKLRLLFCAKSMKLSILESISTFQNSHPKWQLIMRCIWISLYWGKICDLN